MHVSFVLAPDLKSIAGHVMTSCGTDFLRRSGVRGEADTRLILYACLLDFTKVKCRGAYVTYEEIVGSYQGYVACLNRQGWQDLHHFVAD